MIGGRRADLATLDPVEARSPALVRFFGRVMRRSMARSFHGVRLAKGSRPSLPDGQAAIVYANHPSWWDPAFFMVLTRGLFPNRRAFGPIDLEALRHYRFMSRIGLFGVDQHSSRGAARFLRTAERVLRLPDAVLWITPEGRFADPRVRPVRLQPGLAHLVRRCPQAVVVPLALEYAFWDERFLEALCRFGEPFVASAVGAEALSALLEERLMGTMDALAADVMAREPERFDLLLPGKAGIGGVYDLWRRARARLAGERFVPEHGRIGRERSLRP